MGDASEIKIIAEPQMDPNVCSFIVNRPVHDGLASCKNKQMAKGSPLLESLFDLSGVQEVMIAGGTITVAKSEDEGWNNLAMDIGTIIRDKVKSGGQLISEEHLNKEQPENTELMEKVQKILDEMINPGLASHGGGVELKTVKGGTVFVTLSGGCQGCSSARHTLHYGIMQTLREHLPEISDVVDVTDHSAGDNPYF